MSTHLFDPQLRLTGPAPTAHIQLDPRQPYLGHHDVGTPLLGTAMSLEAMAEAAAVLCGQMPGRISQVTAGADCLVPVPRPLSCALDSEGVHINAALLDGQAPVFSCTMDLQPPTAPPPRTCPPAGGPVVSAVVIYACFFHGPAFQVVERAWQTRDGLAAVMRQPLPPLLEGRPYTTVLPVRALEFCLQCAGLLDAATRQYMSVPLSIGAVELYRPDFPDGLWAMAEHRGDGVHIRAYDTQGAPVLAVLDYRTKPMPYASDGFAQLCDGFHA